MLTLATQGEGPRLIPVSAVVRTAKGDVLVALGERRGSLARLRVDPRVALLVLSANNTAITLYGRATVIDDPLLSGVVAVRVNVERTVGHERSSFEIDSGVVWHWTDDTAKARDAQVQAALARLAQSG